MTRGQLVASLGALALSGCGAMRTAARYASGGCGAITLAPAPHGVKIVQLAFTSANVAAPHQVSCTIVYPDSIDPKTIERVAYILPGRTGTARDVIVSAGFSGTGYAGYFSQMAVDPKRPWMLVAMDAGESYFHARTHGENRMALLTDDVPRMLARDLGVHPRREALMGVSMGGYGALLAAESLPQRYCSIAVGGPAIFPSYADEASSVGDAFDGASDYAQHDVIAGAQRLAHIPVLIRAGAKDPFVPGVHAFAAHLPSADVKIISGCHDDNFWRLSAPTLLAFTGKHLTAA